MQIILNIGLGKHKKFYKYKVDNADNNDVFVWCVFLKTEYMNSSMKK